MKRLFKTSLLAAAGIWAISLSAARAQSAGDTNSAAWVSKPMSLIDCLNLGLKQNGSILRGKSDLEAASGLVVQLRAIALPSLKATGDYQKTTEVEQFPIPSSPQFTFPTVPEESWAGNIVLSQSIYSGGQIKSSLRTARLTKDQSLLQYQSVVADALVQIRVAYYDVLQAEEQVVVEDASVKLLGRELDDQQHRFDAGTVPRFNVLQAEVAKANEQPKLIQARNAYRVAKNNLVNLLGSHLPPAVLEDVPLQLTDKLDSNPYSVELPNAVAKALENRTELAALRKSELLRKEGLATAKSGNKPDLSLFAEYGGRSSIYFDDLGRVVNGYTTGAQLSWTLFDGFSTQGKIDQAKAEYQGAQVDVDNEMRSIELEVRTDYSNFIETREVLESQKKVQEEAEEALRLARARSEAGTGTQLDVLNAETALTQARSTQIQALHDYDVTRARLERAIGIGVVEAR